MPSNLSFVRVLRGAILPFVAACGTSATSPTETLLEKGDAHFVVDYSITASRTGRLIGWNLGRGTYYAAAGDTFHPEWRTPERVAAAARLDALVPATHDAPLMRFSGLQIDGAFGGDGYHFYDFVRTDRTSAPTDNMATFEYQALMEESGADPVIMLNFGSATADEAARYARHLNGTDPTDEFVKARTHWGRTAPYGQKVFEVGNEVYGSWNTGYSVTNTHAYGNPNAPGGGDPAWLGKPSSSPADYAARALDYIAAVQAETPDARFWIPLSQGAMDGWGGLDISLPALTPLLESPAVEAVVLHVYTVDDGITLGVANPDAPEFLVAASEVFRPLDLDLRTRLLAIQRAVPLKLAITEYHVATGLSAGKFTHSGQAIVGLAVAEQLIGFAKLDVEYACQHLALNFATANPDPLVEPWYNPFLPTGDGRVQGAPSLLVTELFAKHLLAKRANVVVDRSPSGTLEVGGETVDYNLVSLVAFVDDGGSAASVVLLNRDLSTSHVVTFDIGAGLRATGAQQYAPPDIAAVGAESDSPLAPLDVVQRGTRVKVSAPAHSVVAVSLATDTSAGG